MRNWRILPLLPAGRCGRWSAVAVICCCYGSLPAWLTAQTPNDQIVADPVTQQKPLEFTRVHVPAGRLADIPLGTVRYVPMSAREFEEGVARLSVGLRSVVERSEHPALSPLADAARYVVEHTADGSLAGTVSFDIGPAVAAREMPLGGLDAQTGSMQTAAGIGEAVVVGRRDGSLAVATPQAGTYTLPFRLAANPGLSGQAQFSLPLVPALSSALTLRLPPGLEPMVVGEQWSQPVREVVTDEAPNGFTPAQGSVVWRINSGPRERLELMLVAADRAAPLLSLWTDVGIHGRQSTLTTLVQPMSPWLPGRVRIEKDPDVLVTTVTTAGVGPRQTTSEASWAVVEAGRAVLIELPALCIGGREPLVVSAVAPVVSHAAPLPLLRAPAADWAGGGVVIHVAPAFSLASIELVRCLVVPREVAARWPLPVPTGAAVAGASVMEPPATVIMPTNPLDASGDPAAAIATTIEPTVRQPNTSPWIGPARLFVEQQAPDGSVILSLLPRIASLDLARVTTVDLSPGVIVGRAVCDVRVQRGEAFDLTARIMPGWFIDSVEVIALPTPAEVVDTAWLRSGDEPANRLDWKVLRDTRGDLLRIEFTAALTPARGLGLRITGHRAGIALGEDFSTTELDMVRVDGESELLTLLEFRTSPETTVEFAAERPAEKERTSPAETGLAEFSLAGPDGRVALLTEEGPMRARMRAGFRAASRTARLVRKRPPLDARVQVRLTVRDDRLTESFTFECHPVASDLDSIVVQFSTPVDDRLEWSLLPPAVGVVSARRLDSSDRRPGPGGGSPVGGERWLVELSPAARGSVTIRAVRTLPFNRSTPVPLAWVDGATSGVGHLFVRHVGRVPPQVINRSLTEVPSDPAAADRDPVTIAEFSFTETTAAETAAAAAAELVPGDNDARAWVWREITSTWCHASGATEYETRFDIDNRGRTSLSLGLPPSRRVVGILLDGVRLPLSERAAAGGEVPIELPAGRPLVSLLVRTVAGREAPTDWLGNSLAGSVWPVWQVAPAAVTLDIPVLHREWRLLVPPELELVVFGGAVRFGGSANRGANWATRLLGTTLWPAVATATHNAEDDAAGMPPQPLAPSNELAEGFRSVLVVPAGSVGGEAGVVVVRASAITTAAVLVGLAVGIGTLLLGRGSSWGTLLVCLLAGCAALWVEPPFDVIARAAWWAGLAAVTLVVAGWRRSLGGSFWKTRVTPFVFTFTVSLAGSVCLSATPIAAAEESDSRTENASTASPVTTTVDPLQVFITPIDGGREPGRRGEATALVPEELFRRIIRGEASRAAAAVRVLTARVAATPPDATGHWPAWRLVVDIDADAGGVFMLDQAASAARLRPGTLRIDGAAVPTPLEAAGRLLRITIPDAGRHAVTIDIEPAVQRRGDVETATIGLPIAPAASLQVLPASGAGVAATGLICDRAGMSGVFAAAPLLRSVAPNSVVFDVSRSAEARIVRSVAAGVVLAALPCTAASHNDIIWNLGECRLTGVYDVESGDGVVRSVIVRADPGLEWIAPSEHQNGQQTDGVETPEQVSIKPLGGGRFLVERRLPVSGRMRLEMSFRMPLADPVGVFDVPGAWLEAMAVDEQSVRFVASPSLAVRIDLPAGLTHAASPEGETSFETRFWRGEVLRPVADDTVVTAGTPAPAVTSSTQPALRARLTSQRRRQEIRGSQRESVVFAADQVLIHLDARLDANLTALVVIPLEVPAGCVIDRLELFEDDMLHPETAERGVIDQRWSRVTDTGVTVVVQRPRAGRFRLEVDARIPGRPALRSPLPCLRVSLTAGWRTLIDWRAEDGLRAVLAESSGGGPRRGVDGQFELVAGDTPPDYLLEQVSREPSDNAAEEETPDTLMAATLTAQEGRVELADIRLATDERGRMWGLACFELTATERAVRLQLPRSWRLFDTVVDGRAVESVVATSATAENVWELRLLDTGWPRTVVALFAGELYAGATGRRLLDGKPLELSPPEIVGLPCRQVIWTLQFPAGISFRVAAPARLVPAEDLQAERQVAQERLREDFERAINGNTGWEREQIAALMDARRSGGSVAADKVWKRAATVAAPSFPLLLPSGIVADSQSSGVAAGRITIRAVREPNPTLRGRAIATLSLLACGCLAWILARRQASQWLMRPPQVSSPSPTASDIADTSTVYRRPT